MHVDLDMYLREEGDVGAAVDHALLELKQDAPARLGARRVFGRYLAVGCRRHEGAFHTASHKELVGLDEGGWQLAVSDSSVDGEGRCQL